MYGRTTSVWNLKIIKELIRDCWLLLLISQNNNLWHRSGFLRDGHIYTCTINHQRIRSQFYIEQLSRDSFQPCNHIHRKKFPKDNNCKIIVICFKTQQNTRSKHNGNVQLQLLCFLLKTQRYQKQCKKDYDFAMFSQRFHYDQYWCVITNCSLKLIHLIFNFNNFMRNVMRNNKLLIKIKSFNN